MNTYEIRVSARADALAAVRWELFRFGEVRDVLNAGAPGGFVVVFEGSNPRPGAWLAALERAGYRGEADGPQVAA